MFAQLMVFGFIFVTCGAQEQLTCVRTNPNTSLFNSLKANLTTALLRGYMDLAGGWVAPFNGYQYKVTLSYQSWSASRTVCQQWGSDLAQYGIRDVATRISLYRGLSLRGEYWIGLSDSTNEGSWQWLNDNRANPDDGSLWHPGRPQTSNSADRDCAVAYFNDNSSGLFVWDSPCGSSYLVLCEKRVDD